MDKPHIAEVMTAFETYYKGIAKAMEANPDDKLQEATDMRLALTKLKSTLTRFRLANKIEWR